MFFVDGVQLRNITGTPVRWVNPYEAPEKAKYTDESWYWSSFDSMCSYCGGTDLDKGTKGMKFDRDHILAYSRMEEWHTKGFDKDFIISPYNIVLSCRGCNNAKRDFAPSELKNGLALNYPPVRVLDYIFTAENGLAYLELIKHGSKVLTHLSNLISTYGLHFVTQHWSYTDFSQNISYNIQGRVPPREVYLYLQMHLPFEEASRGRDFYIDTVNCTIQEVKNGKE